MTWRGVLHAARAVKATMSLKKTVTELKHSGLIVQPRFSSSATVLDKRHCRNKYKITSSSSCRSISLRSIKCHISTTCIILHTTRRPILFSTKQCSITVYSKFSSALLITKYTCYINKFILMVSGKVKSRLYTM